MAREGDDANAVGAVARVVVAFCAGASVAVGVMSTLEARRRRTEEANGRARARDDGDARGDDGVDGDVDGDVDVDAGDEDVVRSHG